jgi:hypothetical protein
VNRGGASGRPLGSSAGARGPTWSLHLAQSDRVDRRRKAHATKDLRRADCQLVRSGPFSAANAPGGKGRRGTGDTSAGRTAGCGAASTWSHSPDQHTTSAKSGLPLSPKWIALRAYTHTALQRNCQKRLESVASAASVVVSPYSSTTDRGVTSQLRCKAQSLIFISRPDSFGEDSANC